MTTIPMPGTPERREWVAPIIASLRLGARQRREERRAFEKNNHWWLDLGGEG
jgi:hypothetical protein